MADCMICTAPDATGVTLADGSAAVCVECRDKSRDYDRLKNLIEQLPRTADGVPIVPGMLVYIRVGEHIDERRVIGPYGKQSLLTHEPARAGAGDGSAHRPANVCYSTIQAARSSA